MKSYVLFFVVLIAMLLAFFKIDSGYDSTLRHEYKLGYDEGYSEAEQYYKGLLEEKYEEFETELDTHYQDVYETFEDEISYSAYLEDYVQYAIDFYSNYAVIVLKNDERHYYHYGNSDSGEVHIAEEPDPKTYHTYDVIEYNESDITDYTVMSKKEAENKGYKPCRLCFDN